jgi:hypothetical protein
MHDSGASRREIENACLRHGTIIASRRAGREAGPVGSLQ